MNISIYLEQPLAKKTQQYATKMSMSRNAIIREALRVWLLQHDTVSWPRSILDFKGISDFSSFEEERNDLLPPNEDPFQ